MRSDLLRTTGRHSLQWGQSYYSRSTMSPPESTQSVLTYSMRMSTKTEGPDQTSGSYCLRLLSRYRARPETSPFPEPSFGGKTFDIVDMTAR